MEPATALTASQNYRGGRGGGRQGSRSGYNRFSGGRGRGGRQGSRPPYNGQQHDTVILLVYVDDNIITGSTAALIQDVT